METKNARISGTFLGYEGHGIPTAIVTLDYGSEGSQGFGMYDLRVWGWTFIGGVLDVVGCEWEKLVGKHVRVRADFGRVEAIGHIVEDKWFVPEEAKRALTKGENDD